MSEQTCPRCVLCDAIIARYRKLEPYLRVHGLERTDLRGSHVKFLMDEFVAALHALKTHDLSDANAKAEGRE